MAGPKRAARSARKAPARGGKERRRKGARRAGGSGRGEAGKQRKPRTPRSRKPPEMTLEAWQVALRREFGREQKFRLKNVGAEPVGQNRAAPSEPPDPPSGPAERGAGSRRSRRTAAKEPVFSEFLVTNPESGGAYRVAIRGTGLGVNFCSCPDFAVNTLGTCKHVEWTLARLSRRRGGKRALAAGFRPVYSEVYLRYGAKREVVFHPGTDCPAALVAASRGFFDENGVLAPEGYARFDEFATKARENGHEVCIYDDAVAFIAEVRDRAARGARLDDAFPKKIGSAAFGKLLKVRLYPYQKRGALFAARAGRCLIADDMGLGKTVQAIAAAEILARHAGVERVLVVAPTSLKHQWRQEIGKFSGREAVVVQGLLPRRERQYAEAPADGLDWRITNYDVIHRDLEMIHRWGPDLVILDEAQRIKNWKTRTARSVKRLDSEHAFLLTGTPLENRLEELHSIVEFVDRFRLGPLFRFLHEHQHVEGHGRVVGYRNLSDISKTLEPILIRRTKDEVLKELPERLDKSFFVPMTDEQWRHHEENREVVARIAAKWRRFGFLTEKDRKRLMMALTNMRMSCNSTYLLDKQTDHGVKADELAVLLDETFESPDVKAVVFSQWVRMHELIVRRFDARGWDYVFFHGGVPARRRGDLVKRFRDERGPRVFLSTDAGGVGLNLQAASVVVNMDQPWNPAVLEQRIGRVHRLGQHRPVRVVNFVAENTIEHKMLDVLAFKRSVFAGVLDGGEDEVFLGGSRFKRFMESVEKVSAAVPARSIPDEDGRFRPAEELGSEAEAERYAAVGPRRGKGGRKPASRRGKRGPGRGRPAPGRAAGGDALTELVSAGLGFLKKLGAALGDATGKGATPGGSGRRSSPHGRAGRGGRAAPGFAVERDAETGERYLKLPAPEPETLRKIADALARLAGGG